MQATLQQKTPLILETLVKDNYLSAEEMKRLGQETKLGGIQLLDHLLENNLLTEEQLVKVVAKISGMPYIDLMALEFIDPQTLNLLSFNVAQEYLAIAVGVNSGRLVVAMADADDLVKVNYLSQVLRRPTITYMASRRGIEKFLSRYEAKIDSDSIKKRMEEFGQIDEAKPQKSSIVQRLRQTSGNVTDIEVVAAESPASKALSDVLKFAIAKRCSDVHIESLEDKVRIRIRLDGVLKEVMDLPKAIEDGLMAKLKIETRLRVDEKRRPQDGEFSVVFRNTNIDLRVAISPTIFGEQAVLRILQQEGMDINLESLGYGGRTLKVIRAAMKESSGMILTSGPTGSGKTTSLYSMLQEISTPKVKIVTLEDPVEYKMPGINQIQVNKEIDLTFATGLRSILRLDPDMIMVGEIRDRETALLAVQAALTGHLVFSTLHTSSAAGILPRLLDMGVEPFLIASTIRLVIGQRLVRCLADDENIYDSTAEETKAIRTTLQGVLPSQNDSAEQLEATQKRLDYNPLPFIEDPSYTLYQSARGSHDSTDAYKGRIGVYEAFPVTESIKQLILQGATSTDIQKAAQGEGMVTMRQDGYLKALAGKTSILEVDRVISAENV